MKFLDHATRILFFTGKWCVPCKIMKRNVWADEQVAASVNANFISVTIDMDDPNEAELLAQYSIRTTPTTIFADPHGNVVQQVPGGIGKKEFLELVEKLATERASHTDTLDSAALP